MIGEVNGDLFEFFLPGELDAIGHVANCQGVMQSGIALSIKGKFPDAYKAYKRHEYLHEKIELGSFSSAIIVPGKTVYNLHAQNFYGREKRHLDYEAFYVALTKVRDHMIKEGSGSIGFPYNMGCDRAGGHWKIVEAMINEVFCYSSTITVLIARP